MIIFSQIKSYLNCLKVKLKVIIVYFVARSSKLSVTKSAEFLLRFTLPLYIDVFAFGFR